MPPAVSEWSNLILRWIHVLAGIFWIGQTYYFTKLEGRMALDEEAARNSGRLPQVWLVHSGKLFRRGKAGRAQIRAGEILLVPLGGVDYMGLWIPAARLVVLLRRPAVG